MYCEKISSQICMAHLIVLFELWLQGLATEAADKLSLDGRKIVEITGEEDVLVSGGRGDGAQLLNICVSDADGQHTDT